ncbi:MAG: PEP-CTERM sorting domain-containing protein [Planctomycetota bacterium]|nr:PEP-CTERM sorting domain-containing protein [Planctomycetota bacterium]
MAGFVNLAATGPFRIQFRRVFAGVANPYTRATEELRAMKKLHGLIASVGLFTASSALAAPVQDFHTFKATPATTLTGQGTSSPVVGDLVAAANSANSAFVIGYLATPVILGANVGDSITFSFGVSFNDAVGMSNNGDNFRFALFNENGETRETADNTATAGTANTDNYRGYILGVKNGAVGATGSGGSIRERIAMLASGQNAFAATGTNGATAPSLGAVGGDPVVLTSDVNGDNAGADYTGVLTLTRAAGGVDITGSFNGTNNPAGTVGNIFSASDTTANDSSTYGAIGFLIGNGLSVDQLSFQNVEVVVPEPASLALLGLGGMAFLRRRRH